MVGIKGKSGGKRTGAGRPKSTETKTIISLRIDPDLAAYVNKQGNRSRFINECIRKNKEAKQP